MQIKKWTEIELKEASQRISFNVEEAALDFTEAISEQMRVQNISKADIARKLNKSRAYVTRILSGAYSNNLTLKTMVSFCMALDNKISINIEPLFSNVWKEDDNLQAQWFQDSNSNSRTIDTVSLITNEESYGDEVSTKEAAAA